MVIREFLTLVIAVFLITGCGPNKAKLRNEIKGKATTEMEMIIDKAINLQTVGFGSLVVDNLMTKEKKQELISNNLLPRFEKFVDNTNDIDSLKKLNTDETFRYKMILKSTVGDQSEEALKYFYKNFIEKGLNQIVK